MGWNLAIGASRRDAPCGAPAGALGRPADLAPEPDGPNPTATRALRGDRLRPVAPNILRLTPVTVPGVTRPLLRDLAIRQARGAVRRAVRAIGASVHSVLVASLNDMLDVVPSAQRVFYGTDDHIAGARLTGTDVRWLRRCTRRQLQGADLVLADLASAAEQVVGIPTGHRDDSERL